MLNLVDALFGCSHQNLTFPRTAIKRGPVLAHANPPTNAYVVCLDCGKEFPYDWDRMKVLASARNDRPAAA